jgi:hypothetical protein
VCANGQVHKHTRAVVDSMQLGGCADVKIGSFFRRVLH